MEEANSSLNTRTSIIDDLDANPTSARVMAAAGKLARWFDESVPEVRIAILRNFTAEPVGPYLTVECFRAGVRPILQFGPFDAVHEDVFNGDSELFRFHPDIVVLALRLHSFTPDLIFQFARQTAKDIEASIQDTIDRISAFVGAIRQRSTATILVHNFEWPDSPSYGILDAQSPVGQVPALSGLNDRLARKLSTIPSAYIVDIARLLAGVGYEHGIDDRYWHAGRSPYAGPMLRRLSEEYAAFAAALKGRNRKCLVLDCDNTLWGGIVGEDGLSGIKLGPTHPGSAYVDFQATVLDLYHRGVLLALNSKNNDADAMSVFSDHPHCLLKPEHFASRRINWQDKATNLREIASELNIGIDSLVFLDDNHVERDYVRQALPEVLVVDLPQEPAYYRRTLAGLRCFDTLTLTDEDRHRTMLYHREAQRSELKRESGGLDQYLRSLEMVISFGYADEAMIPRIAQLTQKTNQFNVTTRRYSEEDIRRMAADTGWLVCWARLRDRFDDNGLIAVAIVAFSGQSARIDTLLMSCRVIGRGVEQALLAHLCVVAEARQCSRLLGEFLPTAKNGQVADLFQRSGFSPPEGEDGRFWSLALDGLLPRAPDWFREIKLEEEKS
jgi:FkbH-like protein